MPKLPIIKAIYCITNIATGMKYIGSSINVWDRKKQHFGKLKLNKHYNSRMQRSYNIHGKNNFIFSIVFQPHQDIEIFELRKIEAKYIKIFNSYHKGYNLTEETEFPIPISKEVVQLDTFGNLINTFESISEAERTLNISNITRACSLKTTIQIAGGFVWYYKDDYEENGFRYKPRKSWNNGLKLEDKTGVGHHASKPVIQIDFNGKYIKRYDSCSLASKDYGKAVEDCARGRNKSAYGYVWVYEEKYLNGDYEITPGSSKNKLIIQFDTRGNIIENYENSKFASKKMNISQSVITDSCSMKRKSITCAGFVWMFKKDYEKYGFKYIKPISDGKPLKLYAYDLENNFIKSFDTLGQAAKFAKTKNKDRLSKFKDTNTPAYGYIWKTTT